MKWASILVFALALQACGLFHKQKGHTAPKTAASDHTDIYYAAESAYINGNFREADSLFTIFSRISNQPGAAYYRIACLRDMQGKQDEALYYSSLAKKYDTASTYYYQLFDAIMYRKQSRWDTAGDIYRSLALKGKRRWTLYTDAVRMYEAAGNIREMLGTCRQWESEFGVREEITNAMVTCYNQRSQKDSVAWAYSRLVLKYPERRNYRIAWARALDDAGDKTKAKQVWEDLLRGDAENPEILSSLCRSYETSGISAEHWGLVKKMAASSRAGLETQLGCIQPFLSKTNNPYSDSLEPLLSSIAGFHPNEARAWYVLGDWLYQKRLYLKASHALDHSLQFNNSYQAWLSYMDCLEQIGCYPHMALATDSMQDVFPSNPRVHSLQALAFALTGRYDKAKETCEAGISYAIDAGDRDLLQQTMARILILSGKYTEAETVLKESVAESAEKAYLMSELELNRKVPAASMVWIAQALNAKPAATDMAKLYVQKARILIAAGDFEEAETELQSALKINPNHPLATYMLSDVYFDLKQNQKSADWHEKGIRIAPCLNTTVPLQPNPKR